VPVIIPNTVAHFQMARELLAFRKKTVRLFESRQNGLMFFFYTEYFFFFCYKHAIKMIVDGGSSSSSKAKQLDAFDCIERSAYALCALIRTKRLSVWLCTETVVIVHKLNHFLVSRTFVPQVQKIQR